MPGPECYIAGVIGGRGADVVPLIHVTGPEMTRETWPLMPQTGLDPQGGLGLSFLLSTSADLPFKDPMPSLLQFCIKTRSSDISI